MELTTILIGVAVFVISALLIYLISAFSMREKTFEEVMEEQRRRQEAEREKAKAEKRAEREQQKKKYKKGKQDKVKEKAAQVTEPELKAEPKMVNLEIEPEIIEPTETLGLNTGVRQRGKKDKATKSILQNKGEVSLVAEKTVEVHHKPIVPKDELELKKAHEKGVVEKMEKVKVLQTEAQVKESKKHSSDIKENLPPKKVEKDEEPRTSQRMDDVDKRPAKARAAPDEAPLNGSRLISAVNSAKLSDNEVQTLIEILLNRQGLSSGGPAASESWNKKSQKGDPVSLLKKQLEEKERALQEEQNIAMSANNRVKELRNEMMAEKSKAEAMEKKFQDKIGRQQAEVDALQQRMQHTHEQHLLENNNLQARIRQLEQQGGDRSSAHKLSEENKILQDTLNLKATECINLNEKMKRLEKELSGSVGKIHASEAGKKGLESQIKMYEDKIRKLESAQKDIDSMTNKRVEEVSHELRKSEAKNTSLASDLQKATGAVGSAQAEVSMLKGKLQELEAHLSKADAGKEVEARLQESERKRSDLEGNVKNLEKQLTDLSHRLSGSETEILRLQQLNRSLEDEKKAAVERLQAAPASNGDIHDNGPSLPVAEHERILSEKAKEVSDLTTGLETQKKTSSSLQAQLDNKVAEISELQQQLTQQKAKNNELREKNWKAMEALEKSEKSSAEKVDKALKSARELSNAGAAEIEAHDKSVFQRLFPDVQVSDKLPHKDWVVAFEKQASKKLPNKSDADKLLGLTKENERLKDDLEVFKNNLSLMNANEDRFKELEEENKKIHKQVDEYEKQFVELNLRTEKLKDLEDENSRLRSSLSSSVSDTEKFSQLEDENARLKSEVDNYRSIVSETENKVRQLENSVDEEQKKWQEKLKEAQSQSSQDASSVQRVQELESLVTEQEKQMQEYRRVLSFTEESLNDLEGKVGTEEKAWQGKLEAAETELSQAKDELSSLKRELEDSKGSQEMQIKMDTLEEELREAQEKIADITREKEVLKEAQKPGVDVESLEKQISEIRIQLEGERKKNKELSFNVIKLNGIIKTGQDALTQEQTLVKKLQESLDSKSLSSGTSEVDEVEQLRIKLSEKQKLLEREILANKQLSERLAQLGMLAGSNNDSGTSV